MELPFQIQYGEDGRAGNDTLKYKVFKFYLVVDGDLASERTVFYYHTPPPSFTEDFFRLFGGRGKKIILAKGDLAYFYFTEYGIYLQVNIF